MQKTKKENSKDTMSIIIIKCTSLSDKFKVHIDGKSIHNLFSFKRRQDYYVTTTKYELIMI